MELGYGSLTAPSSPGRNKDCFFSAPNSPKLGSEFFYWRFEKSPLITNPTQYFKESDKRLSVPFGWEEIPGTPKRRSFVGDEEDDGGDDDFAFSTFEKPEISAVFAEELFVEGRIKPAKAPPMGLRFKKSQFSPPKSPRSSSPRTIFGKKFICDILSPKKKAIDFDPFETAFQKTRGRGQDLSVGCSDRRTSRSLSPLRFADCSKDKNEEKSSDRKTKLGLFKSKASFSSSSSSSSTSSSSCSSKGSSKKWRLIDFLLFRRSSMGKTSKDSFKKYPSLFRKALL